MRPLWFAIVIIFYFLSSNWLWKLINIYYYCDYVIAAAKSLQSCPTLCDPIDGSPSGSLVPGILQARTQEWVAISFSNTWKWKVKAKPLSRVRLPATPWTAAHQAPPSLGFSRQEHWSGCHSYYYAAKWISHYIYPPLWIFFLYRSLHSIE